MTVPDEFRCEARVKMYQVPALNENAAFTASDPIPSRWFRCVNHHHLCDHLGKHKAILPDGTILHWPVKSGAI